MLEENRLPVFLQLLYVMLLIVVSMASTLITDGSVDDESDKRIFFGGKMVLTGRTSTPTLF